MRYVFIAAAAVLAAAFVLPLLQSLGRRLAKQSVATWDKVEKTDAKDASGVSKDPQA